MIVVTGVTGWLGKTCIKFFLENYKQIDFAKNVMVFASKDGILNINNCSIKVFNFKTLSNLDKEIKISHIFHTAFLTKEKINLYGKKEYKRINLEIISTIEKLIDNNPNIRLTITSSGAALPFLKNNINFSEDLYGYLKAIEEEKLSKYNKTLILRIFALTGYYIRSPEVFALSEFIHSALNKKVINIHSDGIVTRGYGSAEEIVQLGWHWLFSEEFGSELNCVSNEIDLFEMAKYIKSIIRDIDIQHNLNFNKLTSHYSADSKLFKKALKDANIKESSFLAQIKLSIKGIKDLYNK